MKPWVWLSIIAFVVIILDEVAYKAWRVDNPGHHYSHITTRDPLQWGPTWDEKVQKPTNHPRRISYVVRRLG